MSKAFARAFYNSTAWKACRESYKHKMYYLCERCGEPGEIVHHKKRVSPETIEDPEVLLNFDNLELLCRRCHEAEHEEEFAKFRKRGKRTPKIKDGERYVIDSNGNVRAKTPPVDEKNA